MDMKSETRQKIKWDTEFGQFEATLWDGTITDIRMCLQGSLVEGTHFYCASDKNAHKFVKEVHRCLGELLEHISNVAAY